MRAFPAALSPDPDGGFTVTFRDMPEAITEGDTREEALLRAEAALESALAMYIAAKDAVAGVARSGSGRGDGSAFGTCDGENRALRSDARARRRPCRACAPATMALAASQSRSRSASRFADGACGGRARGAWPAPNRRCCAGGVKQACVEH